MNEAKYFWDLRFSAFITFSRAGLCRNLVCSDLFTRGIDIQVRTLYFCGIAGIKCLTNVFLGGERGDQLWLPKDGGDLPSQDRTKRQVGQNGFKTKNGSFTLISGSAISVWRSTWSPTTTGSPCTGLSRSSAQKSGRYQGWVNVIWVLLMWWPQKAIEVSSVWDSLW